MRYKVFKGDSGSGPWTLHGLVDTDRALVSGLTNGVQKFFKVHAVSDVTGLESAASAVVSATPAAGSMTFPAWPVTVRDPGRAIAPLDVMLDGKPLPSRTPINFGSPRSPGYAYTVDGIGLDLTGAVASHVTSAGIIMRGNSAIIDFVSAAIGGDGLKVDGGPAVAYAVVRGMHVFGIAMDLGSHGDGIQGRGNIERLHVEDCYFDIPSGEAFGVNGQWSNACIIMDNAQGDNGIVTAERCIFRGGNYALMVDDKSTGFDLPTYLIKNCAFIVETGFGTRSPQFGLITAGYESLFTFENCGVYEYDGSFCTFVSNDVIGYSQSM